MTDNEFKERGRALSERKIIEGERSFKKLDNQRRLSGFSNILMIVIGFILLAILIRVMYGSKSIPSLTSFLQLLSDVPTVEIPFLSKVVTDLGDWGLFNFIRDFLQVLVSLFDIIIFLINGLINVMTYVVYFMQWLFIG